jgi:hypothetical protein
MNNGITVINIKKFLLAIHGICIDTHDHTEERHSQVSINLPNYDENGVIKFT